MGYLRFVTWETKFDHCADELISIDIYIWSHNLVSSVEFLVDCEVLFSAKKVEGIIKKEKKNEQTTLIKKKNIFLVLNNS